MTYFGYIPSPSIISSSQGRRCPAIRDGEALTGSSYLFIVSYKNVNIFLGL